MKPLQKKLIVFGVVFAAIWIIVIYTFYLQSQAPLETVTGIVVGRDFYTEFMGAEEGHEEYTRVFVRDARATLWVLSIRGSIPFVAGETYTFQVRMWPSGSYSEPPVTQVTTIYPIEDYNPKVAPSPFSISPMFLLFLVIGPGMVVASWVLRYRRN